MRYLDYRSTAEARDFAAIALGHSPEWVAEIDYVVPASGEWTAVPDGSFDWILSSHALEHSPNLIAFLQTMVSKLKPGGLVVSLLPDKRRTFDAYRPITTIGKVFADYMDDAKRPNSQSVIDHLYYHRPVSIETGENVHFYSATDVVEGVDIVSCLAYVEANRSVYVDIHNYIFTSKSFEAIIRQVIMAGLLNVEQVAHFPTLDGEMTFLNILRKTR